MNNMNNDSKEMVPNASLIAPHILRGGKDSATLWSNPGVVSHLSVGSVFVSNGRPFATSRIKRKALSQFDLVPSI